MKGYLEDLKVGGRPMTDKELADHYKHLYSEVKKQKDDVVEYITFLKNDKEFVYGKNQFYMVESEIDKVLRMLGEKDD